MSWKPSRSSGIMFDKFNAAADKHREEVSKIISEHEVIPRSKINALSKAMYLWWLNDNKKDETFGAKVSQRTPFLKSPFYYLSKYYIRMFERNINHVYKPVQTLILQNNESIQKAKSA